MSFLNLSPLFDSNRFKSYADNIINVINTECPEIKKGWIICSLTINEKYVHKTTTIQTWEFYKNFSLGTILKSSMNTDSNYMHHAEIDDDVVESCNMYFFQPTTHAKLQSFDEFFKTIEEYRDLDPMLDQYNFTCLFLNILFGEINIPMHIDIGTPVRYIQNISSTSESGFNINKNKVLLKENQSILFNPKEPHNVEVEENKVRCDLIGETIFHSLDEIVVDTIWKNKIHT